MGANFSSIKDDEADKKKYGRRYDIDSFETALLDVLDEYDHGLNTSQIADHFEMNRNSAAKYLKTIEAMGKITSRKVGTSKLWYRLVTEEEMRGPGIIVIKEDYTIVKTNEIYASKIRRMREEVKGTSLWEHPPFSNDSESLKSKIDEALSKLKTTPREEVSIDLNLTKKGSVKSESIKLTIVMGSPPTHGSSDGDTTAHFTIMFFDVTAQKEAERRLVGPTASLLLENMTERLVSVQDINYRIIKTSKAVIDLFLKGNVMLEETTCYSLYRNRDHPCPDCPGRTAMEENIDVETVMNLGERGSYKFKAQPIVLDDQVIGYLLELLPV